MNLILSQATAFATDVVADAAPPTHEPARTKIDPDLEQLFDTDPHAKLPYIVLLVEPYLASGPAATDAESWAYKRALVRIASPVIAALERQRAGSHIETYRFLASLAFISVRGDRRSVRALASMPQVEFIAYDGIPRCSVPAQD